MLLTLLFYCSILNTVFFIVMYSTIYFIFSILANLASIIGIVFFMFDKQVNAIIGLSFFCLCLLSFLVALIWGIYSFIKKENERDYQKVSVFTKFESIDGIHGHFETYKVIQSKRLVLNRIEQCFKWSGSKTPKLTSRLQTVGKEKIFENDYDKVFLTFKRPLLFNETGVVHFHAETDDADNSAKPYLDHKVDTFINIIQFRVILKYKDDNFNAPAKVLRKPIDSNISKDYELTKSVAFDRETKSYEYNLINPEPGYYYRILWEK